MARIFKPKGTGGRRSSANKPAVRTPKLTVSIDTLDHQGQGVCRTNKPVLFCEGGLPGESCEVLVTRKDKRVWQGRVIHVDTPSNARTEPFCALYENCGGCQTQHAEPEYMLLQKQNAVAQLLERVAGIDSLPWQMPLQGKPQGYRRKTRLALDARRDGALKLGFRSAASKRIVDVQECGILTLPLQALLAPLHNVMRTLAKPNAVGHISLLDTEMGNQVCLRLVKDLPKNDIEKLAAFAQQTGSQLIFETKPDVFESVTQSDHVAAYSPEPELSLEVEPNDFIQVNNEINQRMVKQAMDWLTPAPNETILDLFCGIGNFSLPLARRCGQVIGVEGVAKMVQRAEKNAQKNGIGNVEFVEVDLSQSDSLKPWLGQSIDKVLLDPAREGAKNIMSDIAASQVQQVLYVSCNPSTFARDAAMMSDYQWRISKIALMDMFPNTAHTELMALFVREERA